MKKKEEKVLVLLTARRSSLRLIERGAAAAQECGGELHILYVQKGGSIFDGEETLGLLQCLSGLDGGAGGTVHICCGDSVAACIGQFVREEGVTQVVMGCGSEKRRKKDAHGEFENILAALPAKTRVTAVPEEARKERAPAWREACFCPAGA